VKSNYCEQDIVSSRAVTLGCDRSNPCDERWKQSCTTRSLEKLSLLAWVPRNRTLGYRHPCQGNRFVLGIRWCRIVSFHRTTSRRCTAGLHRGLAMRCGNVAAVVSCIAAPRRSASETSNVSPVASPCPSLDPSPRLPPLRSSHTHPRIDTLRRALASILYLSFPNGAV
jgi:hypothetical protein